MALKRGGKRVGAGRPVGAKTKRHASFREELWHWCKTHGADPYRYLAKVVADRAEPTRNRLDAARALATYLEPKLAQVQHTGQIEILQKLHTLSEATDEELDAFIALAEDMANGRRHA
jgi:hypothetical protein